jgi:hypothetical protein
MLLWCKFSILPLKYIIREETQTVNAQQYSSNYKWQLHISAKKKPSSGHLFDKHKREFYTCNLQRVKND